MKVSIVIIGYFITRTLDGCKFLLFLKTCLCEFIRKRIVNILIFSTCTLCLILLRHWYIFPKKILLLSVVIWFLGIVIFDNISAISILIGITIVASQNKIEDVLLITSCIVILGRFNKFIQHITGILFLSFIYLSFIKGLNTRIGITGFDLNLNASSVFFDLLMGYWRECIVLLVFISCYSLCSASVGNFILRFDNKITYDKTISNILKKIVVATPWILLTGALVLGMSHSSFDVMSGASIIASIRSLKTQVLKIDPKYQLSGVKLIDSVKNETIDCPKNMKNLLVVMEESTFFDINQSVGDNFFKNGDYGELKVHVFGGGTWLSEFAFLYGLPHTIFTNGEYVSLASVGKIHQSLPNELKKCGYKTIAIIPTSPNFVNSSEVYKSAGFDEIISSIPKETYNSAFRSTDSDMFKLALNRLADIKSPAFIYVLTIQQHGPHNPADPLADYRARLRESFKAYETLSSHLISKGNWFVAWYGDHRPAFMATKENMFITWYSMQHESQSNNREQKIDISFLNDRILQQLGVKSTYLDDRATLRHECIDDFSKCTDQSVQSYLRLKIESKNIEVN